MPTYCEFEVSLKDIRPRIWRRFLLEASGTFQHLHDAIQDASGAWVDGHLHSFRASVRDRADICGTPGDPDDVFETDPVRDSRKVRLRDWFPAVVPAGSRPGCVYAYDFGDGWMADVRLRRIVELPERFHRRLVAGALRFPPEDCGGPWGYQECLAVLAWSAGGPCPEDGDPAEWRERLEWLGEWRPDWDPDAEKAEFDTARPVRRVRDG
mgnify:CR=1 FL=1